MSKPMWDEYASPWTSLPLHEARSDDHAPMSYVVLLSSLTGRVLHRCPSQLRCKVLRAEAPNLGSAVHCWFTTASPSYTTIVLLVEAGRHRSSRIRLGVVQDDMSSCDSIVWLFLLAAGRLVW